MMNSLLCLWKFNFYRNLCKDCFAPLLRQGLDKDSGRNRSIIKHKKGYYLSVIAPIPQLHVLWWPIIIALKKRNNTGFKVLCCYKVFTLHSYSCGILTFCSCATVDSVTTMDGASGVAISTALTVWRETVRNSLEWISVGRINIYHKQVRGVRLYLTSDR